MEKKLNKKCTCVLTNDNTCDYCNEQERLQILKKQKEQFPYSNAFYKTIENTEKNKGTKHNPKNEAICKEILKKAENRDLQEKVILAILKHSTTTLTEEEQLEYYIKEAQLAKILSEIIQ